MTTEIFIEKTWTHLKKLTRKIAATQQNVSDLFKSKQRFQALLQTLSEKYIII